MNKMANLPFFFFLSIAVAASDLVFIASFFYSCYSQTLKAPSDARAEISSQPLQYFDTIYIVSPEWMTSCKLS